MTNAKTLRLERKGQGKQKTIFLQCLPQNVLHYKTQRIQQQVQRLRKQHPNTVNP